jgi:ribosomal subunit interface protein
MGGSKLFRKFHLQENYMKLQFRYKHLGHSAALEDYAREKIGNTIEKFVAHPIQVNIGFEVTDHSHEVNCHITSDHGQLFDASEKGDDMYQCIDLLEEKIQGQLRKNKEKLNSHRDARIAGKGFDAVRGGFDLAEETDSLNDGIGFGT